MADVKPIFAMLWRRAPYAFSLYEVMAETRIGGWDAAQELKRLVALHMAEVVNDEGTTRYRVRAG